MDIIKKEGLGYLIPINMFEICLLDNITLKQICKKYKKEEVTTHKSCYALEKFNYHIKTLFNIELKEYCIKYLSIKWPVCPINGKEVWYKIDGKGLNVSQFDATVNKEFSPKFAACCERMSKERVGSGNPMYGKEAWNKGLDITHPIIKRNADRFRGKELSESHKQKLKEARAKSPIKSRNNKPHSQETREKLRKSTAALWARGVFNRVTSIHIKVRDFLQTLNLVEEVKEEFQVKYFSMDFAFPNHKIAIECQGTFFHIDPRVYPNGPINAIQRRNFGRDKVKKKVCEEYEGWKIIELWEIEINDGQFKEILLCKLKELNLLKV